MKDKKDKPILGRISKGARDNKLEGDKTLPAARDLKPSLPKVDQLILPKPALVAFRKSGGLKFSSKEIVVYPDGRLTYSGTDLLGKPSTGVEKKLKGTQVAAVRQLIEKAELFRLISGGGEQPPDGFAYEIAAQVGSRSSYVEVFDGQIPDSLLPLIQHLSGLFPPTP
jgi:hypothetical protein